MNLTLNRLHTNNGGVKVFYSFNKADGSTGFDKNTEPMNNPIFVLNLRINNKHDGTSVQYDLFNYMPQFNTTTLIQPPTNTTNAVELWSHDNLFEEYCIVRTPISNSTAKDVYFCSIEKKYNKTFSCFVYALKGLGARVTNRSQICLITPHINIPILLEDGPFTASLDFATIYKTEILNLFNLQNLTKSIYYFEELLTSPYENTILVKLAYLKLKYQQIVSNVAINNIEKAINIITTI